MTGSNISILLKRQFLAYFITQFCNAFNDNVLKNAIVILLTYKVGLASKDHEAFLVTLAAGIFILPFILFSPTSGQLADKYNKVILTRIIKSAEILIVTLGGFALYTQNILFLMTTIFLMGTHSAFFGPIKFSIIPEIVKTNQLLNANALVESSTFLAILLGTILGGVLIVVDHGILYVSVLMIIFSLTGWISSFLFMVDEPINHNIKISKNIYKETLITLSYAKTHPAVFPAIIGISWFWLVGGTFLSQFPVFTKDVLHAEAYLVTLFFTTFSIGIALGSMIVSKIPRRFINKMIVISLMIMSLSIVDLYFLSLHFYKTQDSLITITEFLKNILSWHLLVDLICISIASGIYIVPLYTILQTHTPPDHRARIIACNNVINSLFLFGSSIIIMGLFAIKLRITEIFLVIAGVNCIVAVYLNKSRSKSMMSH